MPQKKQLNTIFILSAAGILAALAAAALLLGPRREPSAPTGPVVIETSEAPQPEVVDVAVNTPSPAPTEPLPETACTLLADRRPVLTMSSEEELRSLLLEYLETCAAAPEGERFISAAFACELIFADAEADAHLSSHEDALALLTNTADVVPVRVITEKLLQTELPIETSSTNSAALAGGCRIIRQLGFAGYAVESVRRSYLAGALESEDAPVLTQQREGRALMILNGTWTSRGETPGRGEGVKGKDAGELTLSLPMRGSISSYFGMRSGSMHNGVDIGGSAGTAVTAPGEGLIVYCGERGAYGFVIDIDHGGGFISRIAGLEPESILVEHNQRVFLGDQLGALASAAGSKKPHVHYELLVDAIPTNPLFYMD